MEKKLITLHRIAAAYGGKQVLTEVNLTVCEGDFLGIIGPNGGGKTTLMKLILGLLKPASGEIHFYQDGVAVPSLRIGYLPQYSHIDRKFPISVYDTVISGLAAEAGCFGRFSQAQRQRAQETIRMVGLEGLEQRQIGTLSGGQLQRTLLGRALVSQPQVLILDEPDTYLDRRSESQLYHLLTEVNLQRCAVILVSHDIGAVLQNVRSIACVNGTLDYHPSTSTIDEEWIETHLGCPIDLIGHGHFPHRVLACHGESVCHN